MTTTIDPLSLLANAGKLYNVTFAGKTHTAIPYAEVPALLSRLTSAPGASGIPEVVEITPPEAPHAPEVPAAPAPAASPAPSPRPAVAQAYTAPNAVRGTEVDERGAARAQADFDAAAAAGFAPEAALYTRGTRVIDLGVSNARRYRAEYEKKPLIGEACDDLISRVHAEDRADFEVRRSSLLMDSTGRLLVGDKRVLVEERAFGALCSRLNLPNGAGPYLAGCWPDLRARNINNWQKKAVEAEGLDAAQANTAGKVFEPAMLKLRTRRTVSEKQQAQSDRIVYGVVTDSYTEFDVDKLARAVKLALPPDARCDVHYDGFRAKINALFHSTVAPEDYVAGEFFRAGIVVRTSDSGGGSVVGYAVVEQNLCLNIIVISKKSVPIFRAPHIGDPVKLAAKIREGLKKGEEQLGHFLKAWGYARRDDLVAQAQARGELYEGMSMSAVFAALANGAIERELVPVRGRRSETVSELLAAWERDESADGPKARTVTRAGLVNSFTRWAHESPNSNEFFADEVQGAASSLLWPTDSRVNAPPVIPAIPLDLR